MEVITKNASETRDLGKSIGSTLKGGEILALSGDLGAGKTTFIQGLAESLGVKRIISPTFILMRKYEGDKPLYHLDVYRLEKNVEEETRNLGVEDFWGKDNNVVVIEWAEKIKNMLPPETIWITFTNLGEDERQITIQ